jgi:helicase
MSRAVLRGLFVGVDRYSSPLITELRCAERDARALHSLFADTLGGEPELLCGPAATRRNLEQRLDALSGCHPDDIVVLSFSGHGTDTHQLVTHDAELMDLSGTCISLDRLTELFAAIPSRRLVCFLDCCFSGGMGAKVLHAPERPRSPASAEALINRMAGEGRIILTASAPDEEAWENLQLGHGLLTHYLLQALQGAEEVRTGGRVSVLRLLEWVTGRVIDDAAGKGHGQHPAIRGTIDGGYTWPVFKPCARYAAAFPERVRQPATKDVSSLRSFGLPDSILDAWAAAIPALNALQIAAINDFGVLDGEHLLVSAPTSSGKTLIGELAALTSVHDGGRALFLLPTKALVNDKQREFETKYAASGVRCVRATGDYSDQVADIRLGRFELCLMTYEKATTMALHQPQLLDQVGCVVVDEIQMLADETRGANLEFLLTLLRMRRRHGTEPQVVGLSAVIGETHGLERWLGGRLLRRHERPVPLQEGVLQPDGSFRSLDDDGAEQHNACVTPEYRGRSPRQNLIVPLVRSLVAEGQQVIVFREKRGETEGTANYLADDLHLPAVQDALDALPEGDPSASSRALRAALGRGVAFHNSDLSREERAVIEHEFRQPNTPLRVMVATTTLAMGVNTAAGSVVIAGLDHPGRPPSPYSVAEYKNMVGRAGRLGYTDRGTSYLIAADHATVQRYWNRYVLGVPEDVTSRFEDPNADPRGTVLRVLAAAPGLGGMDAMAADDVLTFLAGSFAAFQSDSTRWSIPALQRAVSDLEAHGLIARDNDDRLRAEPLGILAGESGAEVESVLRLVSALRNMAPHEVNEDTLITLTQATVELDSQWLPMHPKSPKERATWSSELGRRPISYSAIQALHFGSDARAVTLRIKRAAGCLLWMTGYSRARIEEHLTRHVRESAAAGQLAGVVSRTGDMLPLVAGIAELVHPGLDLTDVQPRLLARLQIGLPVEMTDLGHAIGGALTRAQYLALNDVPLRTVADIQGADAEMLASILGSTDTVTALTAALRDATATNGGALPATLLPGA